MCAEQSTGVIAGCGDPPGPTIQALLIATPRFNPCCESASAAKSLASVHRGQSLPGHLAQVTVAVGALDDDLGAPPAVFQGGDRVAEVRPGQLLPAHGAGLVLADWFHRHFAWVPLQAQVLYKERYHCLAR